MNFLCRASSDVFNPHAKTLHHVSLFKDETWLLLVLAKTEITLSTYSILML